MRAAAGNMIVGVERHNFGFCPILQGVVQAPLALRQALGGRLAAGDFVSRYGGEQTQQRYFANVTAFEVTGDEETGRHAHVTFDVHGDMSLGPLQDPRASVLHIDDSVVDLVASHFTTETERCIAGVLTYSLGTHYPIGTNPFRWTFGEAGYSVVQLPVPDGNSALLGVAMIERAIIADRIQFE